MGLALLNDIAKVAFVALSNIFQVVEGFNGDVGVCGG